MTFQKDPFEQEKSLLLFEVGLEIYGVNPEKLKEIILCPPSLKKTDFPSQEASIIYRTQKILIFNLLDKFEIQGKEGKYILVFTFQKETWGFLISKILKLIPLPKKVKMVEKMAWLEGTYMWQEKLIFKINPYVLKSMCAKNS